MRCELCSTDEMIPFKCRYCEGSFCSIHRLPPNHNCAFLKDFLKQPERDREFLEHIHARAGQPQERIAGVTNCFTWLRTGRGRDVGRDRFLECSCRCPHGASPHEAQGLTGNRTCRQSSDQRCSMSLVVAATVGMMRLWLAPIASAASTKGSVRSEITWPRTTRAIVSQ